MSCRISSCSSRSRNSRKIHAVLPGKWRRRHEDIKKKTQTIHWNGHIQALRTVWRHFHHRLVSIHPPKDFKNTMHALQLLTGKADKQRRYAAITFSHNAKVRFNFSSRQDTISNLRKVPFEAGKTNTQGALHTCLNEFILKHENGARPWFKKTSSDCHGRSVKCG